MDLHNLGLFLHLADSSTSAKRRCHGGQPLHPEPRHRRLEQGRPAACCSRQDNRSVRLTLRATSCRSLAVPCAGWRQLKQELKRSRPLRGRLRVFCSVTASYFLLPKYWSAFRRRYPWLERSSWNGDPALAVDRSWLKKPISPSQRAGCALQLGIRQPAASPSGVHRLYNAPQQGQWFPLGNLTGAHAPILSNGAGPKAL